jgi:hypothetical protein
MLFLACCLFSWRGACNLRHGYHMFRQSPHPYNGQVSPMTPYDQFTAKLMNLLHSKPLNGLQNSSLCCRFAGVWIYSQVSPTLGLFAAFFQCCAAIVRVCESIVRSLQKCFTCGFLRLLCIYVIVGILGFCGFIVLLMMFLFSGCSPKGRGSFLDFDSPRLHEL